MKKFMILGLGSFVMERFYRRAFDQYLNALKDERLQSVLYSPPVLYFGHYQAYQASPLKIITLGLNPSYLEFQKYPHKDPNRLQTISKIRSMYEDYFEPNAQPYMQWFGTFLPILQGLHGDFRPGKTNRVLHTDLCTPIPTKPTWSKLTKAQRVLLKDMAHELWMDLIRELDPDLLICSVAEQHLNEHVFQDKTAIYTFKQKQDGQPRYSPYTLYRYTLVTGSQKVLPVYWGKAANKPFSLVSTEQKLYLGDKIAQDYKQFFQKPQECVS